MSAPGLPDTPPREAADHARPVLAACPLCDGRRLHYAFSVAGYRVVRCAECRLLMLNPQPSPSELAAIYHPGYFLGAESADGREQLRRLKGASARRYLGELLRYRGTHQGRLLEVGCGAGEFLAEAQAAGYDVTGLEVSPAAARVARSRVGEAAVRVAELEEVAPQLGEFDVCVLWDVLEHSRDPVGLLRSAHAVLRRGGVLALATPSLDAWSARVLRNRWIEYKAEHLFYFDRNTLQTALFRAGFEGVVIEPGWKVVSLGYVSRHFDRFDVPLLSPLLRLARLATPSMLRDRPFSVVASGVLAFCRRGEVRIPRRLSVIVPAYNEVATVDKVLAQLLTKQAHGLDVEVVVVESASTDGTREKAQAVAGHPRVRLVLEDQPRGKGHAVRAGLARATGDFILIQDADLEYDMDDYDALLEPLVQHREAFVLGSRHGGRAYKMRAFTRQPLLSLFLNAGHWVFATLINLLFRERLKDPFTMYKVFRRDCLFGLELRCNRFDFDIELLVKLLRKGHRPLEIPVNYRSRSFREGKKVRVLRDPWTWLLALARLKLTRIDPMAHVAATRPVPPAA
jgi:2-polyprenyl-3-methyl-5-hydroxy-6-metoxy-1,4-benzoquinol methylase